MKRRFCLLIVVLAAVVPSVSAQTDGGFRSDVKGPPYPWTHRNFADEAGALRFAIVADRAGSPRPGVFERAVQMLNLLQPEFVLSVGDVADNPDDGASVPEFDREHTVLDNIVGKLKMPFFYVAGNHDIYNDLAAQRYRTRHGKPYYSFVYKNVLFLVLCTEDPPPDNISKEQVAYVKQALQANQDVRWTFVFLHKPVFTNGKDTANPAWTQIETSLADRPYTVFAGHWHNCNAYTKGGRKYIVLATTGGASNLAGPKEGRFDEIVWVTLGKTDKEPAIANLALNGILPWDFRPPVSLDPAPAEKAKETPPAETNPSGSTTTAETKPTPPPAEPSGENTPPTQ